ncbi:hypothetical protein NLM16_01980 [Bradyrhizobium brasilense]|nr:hypothetical protein [Bradyrhizobium brasilense]MCP3412866.1 hypothetical protein [Bradyrhizobium brasilense]
MQMHMDAVAVPVNPPDAIEEAKPPIQNIENNPMQRSRLPPALGKAT